MKKFTLMILLALSLFCKEKDPNQNKIDRCVSNGIHNELYCKLKVQCLQYQSDIKVCNERIIKIYIDDLESDIKDIESNLVDMKKNRDHEINEYTNIFNSNKGQQCETDDDDDTVCNPMDSIETFKSKYDTNLHSLEMSKSDILVKKQNCEKNINCDIFGDGVK